MGSEDSIGSVIFQTIKEFVTIMYAGLKEAVGMMLKVFKKGF